MTDAPQHRAETAATRLEPMIADDVSAPFWDATRDQQLTLQWCDACDQPIHYPRPRCPRCLGTTLSWRAARGTGTVYAVSVMHQAGNPMMESRVPYAVALIDLDEGARMLSNVVGIDPDEVAVGARVHVTWEPMADGRHLPQFTVVGAA